ncbi:MAG: ribosomal protein S18-alanine N-acetyltransferase [Cyanobacteriota bacterium]|nr:ribosomal protein S18-alanine N-acetyltransferase [Cyanobacteriota bacterium]
MAEISCLEPTPQDIPALVDLDQRSLGGLWSAPTYQREIDSPNSCLRILTRATPDTPKVIGLGCYWAILTEAHLTLLAVDPAYQGRGLVQWLLIQLLEDARRRGLEQATLEVRCSNQGAISLYQRFGFQTLGQRQGYYTDGEDALILWQKSLQSAEFHRLLHQQAARASQRLHRQGWNCKQPGS